MMVRGPWSRSGVSQPRGLCPPAQRCVLRRSMPISFGPKMRLWRESFAPECACAPFH